MSNHGPYSDCGSIACSKRKGPEPIAGSGPPWFESSYCSVIE